MYLQEVGAEVIRDFLITILAITIRRDTFGATRHTHTHEGDGDQHLLNIRKVNRVISLLFPDFDASRKFLPQEIRLQYESDEPFA